MKKIALIIVLFFLVITGVKPQDYPFETVIQRGHAGAVKSAAFSSDSKYIVTGGCDKTAKLWETETGREMRTFLGHDGSVLSVCFSPNGKYIATGSADKTAKLWETATGKLMRTFADYNEKSYNEYIITTLRFSDDGKYIAVGGYNKKVDVVETETGKLVGSIKVSPNMGSREGVDIRFSSNGKSLLIGENNRKVVIADIKTGEREKEYKGEEKGMCGGCGTYAAYSPDEKTIVAAFDRTGVKILDAKSGSEIKVLYKDKKVLFRAVDYSSDGKYILVSQEDTVKIFNAKSGKLQKSITTHGKSKVNFAGFSPDAKYFITAGNDGTAVLHKTKNGKEKQTYVGYINKSDMGTELDREKFYERYARRYFDLRTSVKLSPDGKLLIIGKKDSVAKVVEFDTGREVYLLKGHSKSVICFDFSTDGKQIVTGSADNTVKLWNAENGEHIKTFKGHRNMVMSVNFNSSGTQIVSSGYNDKIIVWDVETAKEINYVRDTYPFFVDFTPNDVYFLSGSTDKKFVMREIDSGESFRSFVGQKENVSDIDFTKDGMRFVSGSHDGKASVFEINTGYLVRKLSGHKAAVNAVKYSNDNNFIFTGSSDGLAIMWDAKTGKIVRQFIGHKSEITSIQITPDDKTLITCTIDGEIKTWNIQNGKEIYTYYPIERNDMFVKTESGFFDVSDGAKKKVFFVKGMETYNPNQFFEDYYRPGLMNQAMKSRGSMKYNMKPDEKLRKSPPPSIKILGNVNDSVLQKKEITISFNVSDEGDGIDEIKILHNGKRVPFEYKKRKTRKGETITFKHKTNLVSGENKFSVSAFGKGRIESETQEQIIFYESKEGYPNCYILSIGINNYMNESLNLNYAKADASSFTDLISKKCKNLFKSVKVYTLYDEDANKKKISETIDKIGELANPEDVFIFYYAGHGSMMSDEFYFIPSDCKRLYEIEELQINGFSAHEMQAKVSGILALKQLMIMDACQSGGSAEVLGKRGVSKEKAVAQLSRSAGIHVLASAGSEQYAVEFKNLGHGLFTYVLLQALAGKADGAPNDGKITIYELKSYIDDQVPEYTKKLKGIRQYPYSFSGGNDFPISVE